MKIAMIGQKGIPTLYGGVERHVEELSRVLVKNGHEVLAYARSWYTSKIIKNYLGVKIVHAPFIHTKHLDAISHTFFSTLHAVRQKPDIIHYHGVGPALLSWIPRIFSPKTKVIVTFHCIDRYHQKWNFFARFMLRLGEKAACLFPHQTIAVSKTIQNYCWNEFNKITAYIPNGIETNEQKIGSSLLCQWSLAPEKYILAVLRLVKHKGAHYLIEAWRQARRERPDLLRDKKLVIVGDSTFTDGYVRKIKSLAGNDESIVFTGWQNGQALAELFGNTLMLVHPSENEGMSLSILRAMSFGKPVLVSDIPEQQDLVADSRFWFRNTDTDSLAEKIIELLENPEWLTGSGAANKKIVEQNHQWEEIAKATVDVYLSLHKKIGDAMEIGKCVNAESD